MSYNSENITRIANLNALNAQTDNTPGLYHYRTTDSYATVMTAHYFNALAGQVSVGSIILCDVGGTIRELRVTANDGTNVTVAAMSASARGQAATVTAVDTIATGLAGPLVCVIVTENDDPVLTAAYVTANLGDQAAAPVSGSFYLKSWMPTSNANPTPIAATTFGKKVNWAAYQ